MKPFSLFLFAAGVLALAGACSREAASAGPVYGDTYAGKKVYLQICHVCHQPTGVGVPGAFPPLAGSPIVAEADPGRMIRIVLHGLQGPIEVKGATFNSVMPAQGGQLDDREIADVLTYVRGAWDNHAPPVTVEAVAQVRAQAQRTTAWTWAELQKP